MDKTIKTGLFLFSFSILLMSNNLFASEREIIFCVSGFSGTSEQARPILKNLFEKFSSKLGWSADSIKGDYYPDPQQCWNEINKRKSGYALLTYDLYLKNRKSVKMKVLANVDFSQETGKQFYIVTKNDSGIDKVENLKGKKLSSNYLDEPYFVGKIILKGKINLTKDVELLPVNSPLKSLRQVNSGETDAALVDKSVINSWDSLPFRKNLKIIYTSDIIPGPPIVAFTQWANKADVENIKNAILNTCNGIGDTKTCTSMRVEKINAASEKTFNNFYKLY